MTAPAQVVALLRDRGESVGTAESLTGGMVSAALTDVPGASAVVRGAVVAYAAEVKEALLGVPSEVVRERGTVSQECAEAMALGGARSLGADWCLATTGVAGPDPSEGHPVGTVHLALAHGEQVVGHRVLTLRGDRDQIRAGTVEQALELLRGRLSGAVSAARGTVETGPAAAAPVAGRTTTQDRDARREDEEG
ncbi:C-terminal domain of CinA type S [Serinicoccus hydrothermalis]|uniref:C-terminal domain of CinA type S n=1 Tax=Serinicoccus hydrothermalis TaxID=1758689 RepID=A0A1B1NGI9_9MICO|nr:nicotinamide-nucleotide amidohydrolase family protein [Serinicoccus hydrothermalis]ANS80533.1 C-terminal domain of CinA type S [Serinicoccus hydrothermalis]